MLYYIKGSDYMCGRITLGIDYARLNQYLQETFQLNIRDNIFNLPRYNIAPQQDELAVIKAKDHYRVGKLQWGLIPAFAKTIKSSYMMINARSETVTKKPAFTHAFSHNRCIILADGFYEWSKDDKTPYYFYPKKSELIALAALYEKNTHVLESPLFTTTILTKKANALMAPIHHRMPVILNEEAIKLWLDDNTDQFTLHALIEASENYPLSHHQVSTFVNNAQNDNPTCTQKIPTSKDV